MGGGGRRSSDISNSIIVVANCCPLCEYHIGQLTAVIIASMTYTPPLPPLCEYHIGAQRNPTTDVSPCVSTTSGLQLNESETPASIDFENEIGAHTN